MTDNHPMTEPAPDAPPPLPGPPDPPASAVDWFTPRGPLWWYVLRTGGVAFAGAMIASVALTPIFGETDIRFEMMESTPWLFAIAALLIAPPLETLMMALFFLLCRLLTKNVVRLSIASGLFWGVLHVFNSPVNGVAVIWPFYIMSRAYLAWRPLGFWKAFGVTILIHAANNTIPVLLFVLFSEAAPAVSEPNFVP